MSVNTMFVGRDFHYMDALGALKKDNLINVKCWFANKRRTTKQFQAANYCFADKEFFLDRSLFFYSLDWTQKYKKEAAKYTESVEFNQEVYDKVYQKLWLFIDHYSRHDFKHQLLGVHYYLNQFNLLYHFFYGLLVREQIDLILFQSAPHFGDVIIYEIAKALNIKTLIIESWWMAPGKFLYLDNIDDFGDFQFMARQEEVQEIKLEKKFFIYLYYNTESIKKYRFPLWEAIGRSLLKPHQFFEHLACNYLRYLRAKRYQKNLSKIISSVDYSQKYVYFPLHMQPEMSTSVYGGVFCDQVLALELLAKKLPKDWVIYVKENPVQKEFMRDDAFFARLKLIGNLRMTPLSESTYKLMEHSQFVATITGTAGFEAICGGKPTMVFGKAWYQNFEGVFKWHDEIDVNKITNYQIDHAKLEKDYALFLSKMGTGVLGSDVLRLGLVKDYDDTKNIQDITGFLANKIRELFP